MLKLQRDTIAIDASNVDIAMFNSQEVVLQELDESGEEIRLHDRPTFLAGVGFEFGMGVVALFVGWLLGYSPLSRLNFESVSETIGQIAAGLLFAIPLSLFLVALELNPIGPLNRLRRLTLDFVAPIFHGCNWWQIVALSFAAGVGEELLFRGLIQDYLIVSRPGIYGLVVAFWTANFLFGLAHFLNWTYAIWAFIMGLYLSLIFVATESLLVVIVVHAAYDAFALFYILRVARRASNHELEREDLPS